MTTITTKKTLIASSFDVKTVAFDEVLGKARNAITDVNGLVQVAAYSAMYHFCKGFTINNAQRLFDALCVVDGSVDMHRYDSLKTWIVAFFAAAKAKELVKGCPLAVKKTVNEDGQAELAVTWNLDDEGKRKYSLPDCNKEATKPQADALLELLAAYANENAVHTAIADKKAADKAAKAASKKAAETPEQAAAKATLEKAKKVESAKNSMTTAINKAMTVFVENGGTEEMFKTHLRMLIETVKIDQVETVSAE